MEHQSLSCDNRASANIVSVPNTPELNISLLKKIFMGRGYRVALLYIAKNSRHFYFWPPQPLIVW